MTPIVESPEISEIELDFSALDRLPTDQDLPSEDGEPLETYWHRFAMNLLIESIEYHWRDRKDFFVGGNMFLYFSKERVFHKDFRGPDVFVVKGADHDKKRESWISWQEEGRLPNVIIELSSASTASTDWVKKKELYAERLRVPEYFIYDPRDESLTGWRLAGGEYGEPLEVEPGGRIWSDQLQLYIGPWVGEFLTRHDRWLRFFDDRGNLVPIFAEAAQTRLAAAVARADAAEQHAQSEAVRAQAAEAELERLKRELAALRPPPAP